MMTMLAPGDLVNALGEGGPGDCILHHPLRLEHGQGNELAEPSEVLRLHVIPLLVQIRSSS